MISIVIPTYNEEKYLEPTLANLGSLTLPHEIIVTDDKSVDKTVEIARKYTDKVLVPTAKHVTIGANRNAGVHAATGDFLVFMDSTCIVDHPDTFFARAMADFDNNPTLVALTGTLLVYPKNETWGDRLMYFITNNVIMVKNNILHMGEATGKFQMIRREAFEKVGGFSEKLITREDADIFNRLSKVGRTRYDPGLVVYHSGRRAHAIGWPRLLCTWMIESFWVGVFGKSLSKNWDRYWENGLKVRGN